jgi:DNA-directed RNA polymerase sigma subunit (sigma70/sigma32)
LLKAIDVFDYKRGTAFSTVACLWIGQTVSRAYYERKHTYLKIPDALGQGMQHYLSLEKNLGGNLTYDELAQIAKIEGISIPSQEEIEMIHHPLRLDKPAKPDEKDSSTEGELFVTKTASPEDEVINKLLAEEIMALLSPLYQEILRLSAEGYTDGEIAEKFGWTPQNIQEKRARAKRLAKDLVNKHAAQEEIDLYLDI